MKGVIEMNREKCKEINGKLYAISSFEHRYWVVVWTGDFWQQISPTYTYRGWAVRFMNNLTEEK